MVAKQLSIFLENKSGRLTEVTEVLAKEGVNLSALCIAENADFGILRGIVSEPDKAYKALKEYMRRIHNTFPDFWRNMAVLSYGMYDGRNEKIFKQLSIKLLSHKCYFGVSCFWSIVNMILKV